MAQPAAAHKPRGGFSRFSKALPAVPQLLRPSSSNSSSVSPATPHQLPPLPKALPDLPPPPPPPPPPHKQGVSDRTAPQLPDKSPPLDLPGAFPRDDTLAVPAQKMSIPRRPVGGDNAALLSPFPEPSPTASISSLISAYGRTFASPTLPTGAYPATPSTSSRETSPPLDSPPLPEKKPSPTSPTYARKLPPGPASKSSLLDKDVPPPPPSKSEIWRRRPQNDSREISGLKLDHSHGSTVSTAASIMSTSTASTQRPATAVQDEPAKLRKPPSVGGLPGRNVRPSTAQSKESRSSGSSGKPSINTVRSKQSLPSLSRSAATPPTNRPPTPEYQKGESRAPAPAATFISPASPASSPESPSQFSPRDTKDLPPPPPKSLARKPANTTPKLAPAASSSMLTDVPRRKPATTPSSVNGPSYANGPAPSPVNGPAPSPVNGPAPSPVNGPQPSKPPMSLRTATSFTSDPRLARTPASEARTPASESIPSDNSRGSSVSPTRQPRDNEQTPRQRPPPNDSRIVQTEQGPMYRGRDGTLYAEMTKRHEPDARAFRFPTWKGKGATTTAATEGVFAARELKESHYSCFQRHATMNRRTNRHYPLTCQTCSKANADDRWACGFCHLRICEPCFRVLETNQRDLRKLVAEIGRRTPLSLSSDSRPASAFGL